MTDRRCILTRTVKEPEQLIRFVVSPEGVLTPDIKRVLPGRGCWVTATKDSVDSCVAKGLFAKSFKEKIIIPEDLSNLVDKLLTISCLRTLLLLKKAGFVFCGATQVTKLIQHGKASIILHTTNASEDGKRKINQAAYSYQQTSNKRPPTILSLFSNDEMILVFGRAIIMHMAVVKDVRTTDIIKRIQYLSHYRNNKQDFKKDN